MSPPPFLPGTQFSVAAAVDATIASAAGAPSPVNPSPLSNTDTAALDEMLLDASGRRQHWPSVPQLVVLTSVMEYRANTSSEYAATSEQISKQEAASLATDLTAALKLLTNGAFEQFASVDYESVPAGATVAVVRPQQIVVGRYQGVRRLANTIGFGGRKARRDGAIVGAAVMLDDEFDRTSSIRRLLRTHELGHALGFNHVKSRASIMNPRIGAEMTDYDRQVARLAFQSAERSVY